MGRVYINGVWVCEPDECQTTITPPVVIPPTEENESITLSATPAATASPTPVLIVWIGAVNATNSDRIDIINSTSTVLSCGVFGLHAGSFNFLTNSSVVGSYTANYIRVISTGYGISETVKATATFDIVGIVTPVIPPIEPPIITPVPPASTPPGGGWIPSLPPTPQPPPQPPPPPKKASGVKKYLRAQLCQLTNLTKRGVTFASQCGDQLVDINGNDIPKVILVPLDEAQTIRKKYNNPPQEYDAINITFDHQDQCYWVYVHKFSTGESLLPASYYPNGLLPVPVSIPTDPLKNWQNDGFPKCNDCCKGYVKTTRCNHTSDVIYFDRYSSKFDGGKVLAKSIFPYIDTDLNIRDCYQLTDTFVRKQDIVVSPTSLMGNTGKITTFYSTCDQCLYYTAERCDGLLPSIYVKASIFYTDPFNPELRNGIEYGGICYWINRNSQSFPTIGSTAIDDISSLTFFGTNLANKVSACATCSFPACTCDAAAWANWAPGGAEACADDLGWIRRYRIVGYNPAAVPFNAFNPACAASVGAPDWDGTFTYVDTQAGSGCGTCNWLAAINVTSLTLGTVRNSVSAVPCTSEINIKLVVSGWYLQVYCGDWGGAPIDYLVWRGKKVVGQTPAGIYYQTADAQSSTAPSSIAVEAY